MCHPHQMRIIQKESFQELEQNMKAGKGINIVNQSIRSFSNKKHANCSANVGIIKKNSRGQILQFRLIKIHITIQLSNTFY